MDNIVQQAQFSGSSSSNHSRPALSTVSVFVVSPSTHSERQFDVGQPLGQLKARLASITGIPAQSQLLTLHDGSGTVSSYAQHDTGKTIAALDDDARTLLDYGVTEDGYVIKVSSSDATTSSNLETFVENPHVQKFELTREEYEQRADTVKAYKERNKIGRFAAAPPSDSTTTAPSFPPEFVLGARVKVSLPPQSASSSSPFPGTFAAMTLPQRQPPSAAQAPPPDPEEAYVRRGTIRYLGPTKFGNSSENWVGVEYDEPVGKNDGSVNGERYFSCRMKYGGFVKAERCEVGEWVPEDEDDGLDTDDELGL